MFRPSCRSRRMTGALGIRSACGREIPVERRGGDAEALCDLRYGDIGVGEHRLCGLDVVLRELWRTAPSAANPPRSSKTRLGALANQAALEFRQSAKHVKDQPPLRRGRVKGFGQAAK